jgi:hypothetical protein
MAGRLHRCLSRLREGDLFEQEFRGYAPDLRLCDGRHGAASRVEGEAGPQAPGV